MTIVLQVELWHLNLALCQNEPFNLFFFFALTHIKAIIVVFVRCNQKLFRSEFYLQHKGNKDGARR